MIIELEKSGFKMEVHYDDNDGTLQHVVNSDTRKHMMMEFCQIGMGFTIEKSSKECFIPMTVCNGTYYRIMDANLFIPKYIFIENNADNN